jgi:protein AATF/BFR2
MKTRTRRAGGGLAAELAGLANPAPVSTELPDDDFDPTGGAVARAADREDATSSDDSDADANAFGDDDEGVFEPTKADRATVGKGKLRMRAGIAIDDGEYVGKSSSRAAMEGAWAGEEDERDESDESDDASDDHAMVTDSDDKSDSDETNDDDDDGESEEASEEENPEEDDASDSESQSESDSDGEGALHETSAANALEAELAAMRAEEAEANRLLKTKSQNVAKGAAVRTQNACWERSLRTRIVLQKGLTLAAKMPAPEYAKAMRDADAEVAPALAVAAASARGALDALLRLQAALMDGNPAIGEALREGENDGNDGAGNAKKRKTRGFYAEAATLDLLSKPAAAVWRAADAAFQSYAPFRDQSCDRWHRKAQVTSGKTGSVGSNPGGRGENLGALRAFDQSLSQQVRAAMRPPDRLVNRSRPPAHLAPRRLGEPEVSLERKEKNHDEDGFDDDVALLTADARADDRVAEVYEDADFYEQALKEFLETRGAGSNLGAAGVPAASQPPKRRKQVDRRASKGRKLRYHVQQPLVNFCAPVELEVPGWAEKVFTRLFASSA